MIDERYCDVPPLSPEDFPPEMPRDQIMWLMAAVELARIGKSTAMFCTFPDEVADSILLSHYDRSNLTVDSITEKHRNIYNSLMSWHTSFAS